MDDETTAPVGWYPRWGPGADEPGAPAPPAAAAWAVFAKDPDRMAGPLFGLEWRVRAGLYIRRARPGRSPSCRERRLGKLEQLTCAACRLARELLPDHPTHDLRRMLGLATALADSHSRPPTDPTGVAAAGAELGRELPRVRAAVYGAAWDGAGAPPPVPAEVAARVAWDLCPGGRVPAAAVGRAVRAVFQSLAGYGAEALGTVGGIPRSALTAARGGAGRGPAGTLAPDVCELVREVFGDPFRPVRLDPRCRTMDAAWLARRIFTDQDFDAMPVLADALEDAGCTDARILGHCRGPAPHVRGCWVLDLLLPDPD